ncbi:putative SP-containing membrane protein [Vairimorpha necatrix]|uniref:SP-containing membrane protein n=1 Tax=Vairimorpha necatrix TaxID=6039 RepID=A0AAX4JCJ3_9MICR
MLFILLSVIPFIITRKHAHHASKLRPVVTYDRLNVSNHELKKILRNELVDVLPAISEQFETNFRNRNIDFDNYRDLIFVSKRVRQNGGRKKIEYTVTEKIIPKNNEIEQTKYVNNDITVWYVVSFFFLLGLGFTFLLKYKKINIIK